MKTNILKLALVLPWSVPACSAFVLIQPKAINKHHAPSTTAVSYTNSNTDVLPFVLRPFDLNGDGKLDGKDIKIFQSNIVNALDLNGDGEINEKDAWRALQLVVLTWALTVSPVAAKGGGGGGRGGGGGHGGGGYSRSSSHQSSSSHSSSSSSGSSRQYYSTGDCGGYHDYGGARHYYVPSSNYLYTTPVLEPYRRKSYEQNRKYNKPWNPGACYDLPGEGESIDILVQGPKPYYYTPYYGPGVVKAVNEPACMFDVEAGGEIQSFKTPRNWDVRGGLITNTILVGGFLLAPKVICSIHQLVEENKEKMFDDKFALQLCSKEVELYPTPASGWYVGSTQESDGANQAIDVNLIFDEETRTITGGGYDSDDGIYSLNGEWVGGMVKWIEYYNEFSVDVRGRLSKDGTEIDSRFVSSRGIRGTFKLRAKKIVDWIPFL